jgi:hypothetical protein
LGLRGNDDEGPHLYRKKEVQMKEFAPVTEYGEAQCKRCGFVYEMQTMHCKKWEHDVDIPIVCEGCGEPVTCDWCEIRGEESQLVWQKRRRDSFPPDDNLPLVGSALFNLTSGDVYIWRLCPKGCIVFNPFNVNMHGNLLRDEAIRLLEAGKKARAIEKLKAALFHYRQTGLVPGIEWGEKTLRDLGE